MMLAFGSGRFGPIVDDESSEESEESASCSPFLAVNGRSNRGTDESRRRECPDFLCRGALGTSLAMNVANACHSQTDQSDRIVHLSLTSRPGGCQGMAGSP